MKKINLTFLVTITFFSAFSQSPAMIIDAIKKAQQNIKWVNYTVKRQDSLLTGVVRNLSGSVTIKSNPDDAIFGFQFWAQQDENPTDLVYDGHIGYTINKDNRTYSLSSNANQIHQMINSHGGRLVIPDLIKIDTTHAIGFNLSQDEKYYFLVMRYAENKPEEVSNRFKVLTINKANMLPLALRNHSETNGRVQDLYYHINEVHVNDPAFNYDFSLAILKDFQQEISTTTKAPPVFSLKNEVAPAFTLHSFTDSQVSLANFQGKVVLLDFWEVWCGPCIQDLPKIQRLYDDYKDKGLQVLGIMNDLKQLDPAQQMLKNKKYTFPMLMGNIQLKNDYKLDGSVPLYILINRHGTIQFIGGSEVIESEIKKAILE